MERRGSMEDLRWFLQSANHPVCPLTLSKASLQLYLDERPESEREALSWKHYYVLIQDIHRSPGGQ